MTASATELTLGPDAHTGGNEQSVAVNGSDYVYAYQSGTETRLRTSGGGDFALSTANAYSTPEVDAANGKLIVAWGEVSGNSVWTVKASVMDFPTGTAVPSRTTFTVATGKVTYPQPKINGVGLSNSQAVVSYDYIGTNGWSKSEFQRVSLTGSKLGKGVVTPAVPSVDARPDGSFVLVNSAIDVFAQQYTASGAKFGEQIIIANTAATEKHGNVEYDGAGNFVVAYHDGVNAKARIVTADESPDQDVTISNTVARHEVEGGTFETRSLEAPSIDVNAVDGSFTASWVELDFRRYLRPDGSSYGTDRDSYVRAQRFTATGAEIGVPVTVAVSNTQSRVVDGTAVITGDQQVVEADQIVSLGGNQYLSTFWRRDARNSAASTGLRYGELVSL